MRALLGLLLTTNSTDEWRSSQRRRLLAGGGAEGNRGEQRQSGSAAGASNRLGDGVRRLQAIWGSGDGADESDQLAAAKHMSAVRYPVRFSYYLSGYLPLSDEEKLSLLACPSVELRLR